MTIRTIPLDPEGKGFIVTENVVGFSIIESNIFTASINFKDTIPFETKITEWKEALTIMKKASDRSFKLMKKGVTESYFIEIEKTYKQRVVHIQRLSARIRAYEIIRTAGCIVTTDKLPSFPVSSLKRYNIRTRRFSKKKYIEELISDHIATTWTEIDEHWFSKTTSYDIGFGLKSGPCTVLTRFKFPTSKDAVEYLNRNNFL